MIPVIFLFLTFSIRPMYDYVINGKRNVSEKDTQQLISYLDVFVSKIPELSENELEEMFYDENFFRPYKNILPSLKSFFPNEGYTIEDIEFYKHVMDEFASTDEYDATIVFKKDSPNKLYIGITKKDDAFKITNFYGLYSKE